MTPEEIAEIKAELEAITPGPWKIEPRPFDDEPDEIDGIASEGGSVLKWWASYADDAGITCEPQDAQFIAKAPERIASLIAEVERLQKYRWFVPASSGDVHSGEEFFTMKTVYREVHPIIETGAHSPSIEKKDEES